MSLRAERSYLFCPGDRPDRFPKAMATAADRVVTDLEDAVLPEAKSAARDAAAEWLVAESEAQRVLVRVNGADTPWFDEDVRYLAGLPGLAGVMLPKTEGQDALLALRSRLGPAPSLVALVESLRGVAGLRSLAASPGLQRLAFGSVDFAVEAGIRGQRAELDFIRSQLVFESALAGLAPPVDGVTVDVRREDMLREDVAQARRFGFGGKLCIHPNQVAAVNEGFLPSADEVDWARRVVAARAAGPGAIAVDGKLVDGPVRLQAEAILRQSV